MSRLASMFGLGSKHHRNEVTPPSEQAQFQAGTQRGYAGPGGKEELAPAERFVPAGQEVAERGSHFQHDQDAGGLLRREDVDDQSRLQGVQGVPFSNAEDRTGGKLPQVAPSEQHSHAPHALHEGYSQQAVPLQASQAGEEADRSAVGLVPPSKPGAYATSALGGSWGGRSHPVEQHMPGQEQLAAPEEATWTGYPELHKPSKESEYSSGAFNEYEARMKPGGLDQSYEGEQRGLGSEQEALARKEMGGLGLHEGTHADPFADISGKRPPTLKTEAEQEEFSFHPSAYQSAPTTPTAPSEPYKAPITPSGASLSGAASVWNHKNSSRGLGGYEEDPFDVPQKYEDQGLTQGVQSGGTYKEGMEQGMPSGSAYKEGVQGGFPSAEAGVATPSGMSSGGIGHEKVVGVPPGAAHEKVVGSGHSHMIGSQVGAGVDHPKGEGIPAGGVLGSSTVGSTPASSYVRHGDPVPKGSGLKASVAHVAQRAQQKLFDTTHHLTAGAGGKPGQMFGTAWGKLDNVTRRMLQGGEHLWRQSFPTLSPSERLHKSFACLLSTEAGAVAGVLYVSDKHLAFCSDRAMQRAGEATPVKEGRPALQYSYYKAILPFSEVQAVNSKAGQQERDRSLQVVMKGGETIWFFGFVNFDKALYNVNHFRELALHHHGAAVPGVQMS